MTGATWTSSHEYGSMMINHDAKLYYVHIPKCASSWMKKYLDMSSSWHYANFTRDSIVDYKAIIILRDPVERWVSASPANKKINSKGFRNNLPILFDNLTHWMADEHSAPQADFISGLNLDNAVFFYCDSNLSNNIQNFLSTDVAPIPAENVQPDTELFRIASAGWREILSNPIYLSKFKEAYKKDYDLINQVKFYDPR